MHELVRLGEEVTTMDRQGRSSAPTLTLGFSLSSWAWFLKEATDGRTRPQTLCCLQSRRGRVCVRELRNLFLGCGVTANLCHLSPSALYSSSTPIHPLQLCLSTKPFLICLVSDYPQSPVIPRLRGFSPLCCNYLLACCGPYRI